MFMLMASMWRKSLWADMESGSRVRNWAKWMKSMFNSISSYMARIPTIRLKNSVNKKFLLRERKRHTDRCVSSTPSVSWSGVPPGRGYPPARSDRGVPKVGYPPHHHLPAGGTSPATCDMGHPPRPGPTGGHPRWGMPLPAGGTPQLDLAGVPPPGVDRQTDTCQNITFPRATYAVGNNVINIWCWCVHPLFTDFRSQWGDSYNEFGYCEYLAIKGQIFFVEKEHFWLTSKKVQLP